MGDFKMARDKALAAHSAHVLYAAFILERRHDVGAVARRMGIAPGTLYAYCENRESFPAHRLAQLYAATSDAKLLSDMLELGAVGLVLTEAPPASMGSGVHRAALRLGMDAGAAQAAVHEAMADGIVDDAERRTIDAKVDELQRSAQTLRLAVR